MCIYKGLVAYEDILKEKYAKEKFRRSVRDIDKLLLSYIDELYEYKDIEKAQFEYGERTAYTECLEWIQEWK